MMSELFSQLKDITYINTLISIFTGAMITYIFTIFKMKKDREIEFEKEIASNIALSLYDVRSSIKQIQIEEIYDVDNALKENVNASQPNDFALYPSILNNSRTLIDFWNEINDLRIQHDLYLSYPSSAYLLYMSNYLLDLIRFLGNNKNVDYHLVGTLLRYDLLEWENSFDKQIVKEINTRKLKLKSKNGLKWEKKKQKINELYWNKSFLKEMISFIEPNSNNFNEQVEQMMVKIIDELE